MGSGENQIQAEEYLTQAQELTREGLKELRESINEMTKEESSELVTQAVMQLTRSVKEIKMEVTIQGEDDEMYSSLTKVVHDTLRESITNCLKYSKASQMDVVVRFLKNRLELVIADDGVGCEEIVYNHGLKGICDRIEEKGGKDVAADYDGSLGKSSLNFPVYDGTLMSFVREAQKTVFMDKNYCYSYTKRHIRTREQEEAAIQKATGRDADYLGGVIAKYVTEGMRKSGVWQDAVERKLFLNCILKLKEILDYYKRF